MTRRDRIPNLGGSRAVVLHKPHANTAVILRQLAAIGLEGEAFWPDLPTSVLSADFVFFDADLCFDEQFPWAPGEAPMPMVALIGSEAPGRIEWALRHRADAHLVKPVGPAGIYSALLIARQGFDLRQRQARQIADLERQVAERRTIVAATLILMEGGKSEGDAFAALRLLAMSWQITVEAAARRVCDLKNGEDRRDGSYRH
ncbi:ANTAR domain-containing response regulator [Aureimonas sp. AU12]|uniref:ANTAR domain-containing response regulator n=1 Tax=Aureimonas sp. AU12 TaxID=1638161 RepID=UPI0007858F5A|nr:ANTAR domain-containing protein [Aureimonas sp. AU12]